MTALNIFCISSRRGYKCMKKTHERIDIIASRDQEKLDLFDMSNKIEDIAIRGLDALSTTFGACA